MKKTPLNLPILKTTSLLLTIFFLSSMLSGCGKSDDSNSNGKIKIVAAENFYGEVAQAVGGDLVEVVSLLTRPGADPHDYEPTPQASKAIADAKLIIYNGIGYDEWMSKMIEASGNDTSIIVIAVASDIMKKAPGDNEHLWYNPETFPKYAKELAKMLSQLDPANESTYLKQADDYIASLVTVTELVAELRQSSALPIAVSEPIFDYMAEALNLTIMDKKFEMAAEEGVDPSPTDVAALQDAIKSRQIKLFVNNMQSSSPVIENMVKLSQDNRIPIIEVTETLPQGKNYVQWMMDILNQIKAALKG